MGMEQRQLDEMNDVFSEEFIDEEDLIDEPRTKMKASASKKAKPVKKQAKVESFKKMESKPKIEIIQEDVHISSAKEPIQTSSPVDPWAGDKKGGDSPNTGLFQDASTWKAITGIVLILLVLSVLTQGFRFTQEPKAEASLTQLEAEGKALSFVNTNLLRAPFTAEVVKSEDADSLFKVTLRVAGQDVDSYITKNGKLFFPQGFATDVALSALDTELDVDNATEEELATVEPALEEPAAGEVSEEGSPPEITVEKAPPAEIITIPLRSKKWQFLPDMVSVNRGNVIQLLITPDNAKPEFALPEYTFIIPELGIEETVSGPTMIEFTADRVGRFEFRCGSCAGTQAQVMKGTLEVK